MYKVCHEGYRGHVTLPDGTEGITNLYPPCDKSFLEGQLAAAKKRGEILDFIVTSDKVVSIVGWSHTLSVSPQ